MKYALSGGSIVSPLPLTTRTGCLIALKILFSGSLARDVHRGEVKYTEHAFNKTTVYKQKSRNHLLDQIESFRVGDKDSGREDDLLDTFCYGIAVALGNSEGF